MVFYFVSHFFRECFEEISQRYEFITNQRSLIPVYIMLKVFNFEISVETKRMIRWYD